MQVYFMVTADW